MSGERQALEAIVGLLRQGQHREALRIGEDVLSGKIHVCAGDQDTGASLELQYEDDTPEIPEVMVDGKSLVIGDEGWIIDRDIQHIAVREAIGFLRGGEHKYGIEDRVREVLRFGVKIGLVRKK